MTDSLSDIRLFSSCKFSAEIESFLFNLITALTKTAELFENFLRLSYDLILIWSDIYLFLVVWKMSKIFQRDLDKFRSRDIDQGHRQKWFFTWNLAASPLIWVVIKQLLVKFINVLDGIFLISWTEPEAWLYSGLFRVFSV